MAPAVDALHQVLADIYSPVQKALRQ